MELQILLAGVEFGPYTIEQARELLGEGFLSETDPAKRLDETDWLPLSQVLAQIPPAADTPEEPEHAFSSPPEASTTESVPYEPAEEKFETEAQEELAEEPEASTSEFDAPSEMVSVASEETAEPSAPILAEESAPVELAVTEPEPEPAPEPKAIELKAPSFSAPAPAPTPIVSATPLIQVSLPAKAKKTMRTGSLLAQDALRAARDRSGILSPVGRTAVSAAPPVESPSAPAAPEPEAVRPPAPRRRLQLNLGTREETESEPVTPAAAPRKAIRLTGRITLPGLEPKPELPAAQPPSLSGPLIIGRPPRARSATEIKSTTRPLTMKEKSSFLIGQIARPTDVVREEPEVASAAMPAVPLAERQEIPPAPAPSLKKESAPDDAPVRAAGEETAAQEPLETKSGPGSITALLRVAGTEAVAEPPEAAFTESGALPIPAETSDEPDFTSSGGLTASGDLAERRSLKITGPLKHSVPRAPIRLGSPAKPGDSSRLPYFTGERPATSALPLPQTPPKEPPLSPASEESLPHRPETGKIPVSAMPNEGVRIRARRITTKVPVSEKTPQAEPAPARAVPPPLPDVSAQLSTSEKKGTLMSITPPSAETGIVVPPPVESKQAASSTGLSSEPPALPSPVMATEAATPPVEAVASVETPAAPTETADPADVAKPDKIRLRRPVKLELSSRAKIQESGRLTLEAFSKMASLELPAQAAAPLAAPTPTETKPPVPETSIPLAKNTPALAAKEKPSSAEPVIPPGPNAESAPDDYHPPRLEEAPPLAWKSSQPKTSRHWEWLSYVVITFLVVTVCVVIYKVAHRTAPVASTAPSLAATAGTNTSGTEAPEPPASAAPPTMSPAPATASIPSPAAVPAPASSTASASAAAPRSPPSSTSPPPANAAPSATIQDLNRQVDAFVGDGVAKYQHNDFTGALDAYNQALNLNPKSAPALYNRGLAKAAQSDPDGAIADYTEALQSEPNLAAAYYSRGLARHSKGDLDGAISDYTQATQLDPKNAQAYFYRGLIRMQKDDIDGAIVDSTRALELDPHLTQSYYDRALGRLAKGALNSSLSDMKTFCQLAPLESYTDYARLYIWLIESQQGHMAEANQELSKAMNNGWNGAATSMVTRIGEYLLGQIPEAELVKASASDIPVKDQGQRCEAWYFIGMRHLQAGDKQGAAEDLRKCIGTQKADYCEFILAQETLKNISPSGAAKAPLPAPRAQAVTLPDPGTMSTPDEPAASTAK